MTQRTSLLVAGAIALAMAAGGAHAQPPGHPAVPAGAPLPAGHPAVNETTVSLQGGEAAWIADSHMHAFYDLTVATFSGKTASNVDAYEQKAFAIFRDFGASHGMSPAVMQDHLKLIPRQVAQIVKEDPKVLASYDNFVAATFGPQ